VITINESQPVAFELPNTPAGKMLGKFLQSLNSGDLATMKKFHQETGGDGENAEQDLGFYQQSGGVRPHSVLRSAEFEINVLAQAKKDGRWLNFGIVVESKAPYAVTELRVHPASAPTSDGKVEKVETASPSSGKKSEEEFLRELPAWLDKQAAEDNFS